MKNQIRPALVCFLMLTLITGVIYPLLITGAGILLFPDKASGSLIYHGGKIVGSALIGQPFDDPRYFWSRPSATGPFPYNAEASSGSNWGPSSPHLHQAVRERIARVARTRNLPVDQVTTLVKQHIEPRAFGVLGEPRVNVLLLNLALDHPEFAKPIPRVRHSSGPILYRWRGFLPESR